MHIGFYIVLLSLIGFISCKSSSKSVATLSTEQYYLNTNNFIDAIREKIISNPAEAKKLLQRCIERDPLNAAANYEMARLLVSDNAQEALKYAQKAVEIDKKNVWYTIELAVIYKKTGNFKNAIACYKKVTELNPYQIDYYLELGNLYLMQNKPSDAIEVLNQLELKIGISEDVSIQKKDLYVSMRKTDNAINEMKKLITSEPSDTRYYSVLADLYLANKQNEEALAQYKKILEISPSDPYVNLSLAQYYSRIGDEALSIDYLKKAFVNPMLDLDNKIQILFSYYQMSERRPEIKKVSKELLELLMHVHPNEAKVYSMYADFLMRDGEYAKAIESFKKVNTLDPSKYVVWSQLMQAQMLVNDYKGMLIEGNKAIELFPEQPMTYLYLGFAYNHTAKYDSAMRVFEKGIPLVIENDPLLSQMYSELGNACNELKRYTKSDSAFDKALVLTPLDYNILNNYSYYLSERNTGLEKAKKMAQQANELHPNDPAYQDTYGWVLYKAGDFKEAQKWLLDALKNGGDKDAVIIEHVGDVVYKLGNITEALDYWKKAQQVGKGSEFLNKKVEEKKLIE